MSELINAALIFVTLLLATLLVYLLDRKRWRLWRIIQSGDPQQVENTRDQITPKLVRYPMKQYWRESNWEKNGVLSNSCRINLTRKCPS